jgi:hypothetical protein
MLNQIKSVSFAAGFFLSLPSFALTPTAHLENAQVYAIGKTIQAFRVPTVDSNGVVKYYNLTLNLNVLNNGTIDTTAITASTQVANSPSNKFIPGIYVDGIGNTCTVVTALLLGGRTEVAISCSYSTYKLQANWVTGLIPGHPFEQELKTAGINTLPYYSNYSWGKIAYNYGLWWGCMTQNEIISARQLGNTLSIGGFDTANIQKCGVNLVKT